VASRRLLQQYRPIADTPQPAYSMSQSEDVGGTAPGFRQHRVVLEYQPVLSSDQVLREHRIENLFYQRLMQILCPQQFVENVSWVDRRCGAGIRNLEPRDANKAIRLHAA
jgi:hypothetical protein